MSNIENAGPCCRRMKKQQAKEKIMITEMQDLPSNMVGFKASGQVTEADFKNVVMPKVQQAIDRNEKLNYLLVLNTDLKNFTAGAWLKDAVMGVKHLFKWNRAAIVSDVPAIRNFTDGFSVVMPGEFKGFEHKDLQQAIDWASGRSGA